MKKVFFISALLIAGAAKSQFLEWHNSVNQITVISTDTDSVGNVYSTGFFSGTRDFDPGPAVVNRTSAGLTDIFVRVQDAQGNFVDVKTYGGPGDDRGNAIGVDQDGIIYVTGAYESTFHFDAAVVGSGVPPAIRTDVFLLKLEPNLTYSNHIAFGGTGNDEGNALVTDGHVYIAGSFEDTVDFDPVSVIGGPAPLAVETAVGGSDIFAVRYNSDLDGLYLHVVGNLGHDEVEGVALGNEQDLHLYGHFDGSHGPTNFQYNGVGPQILPNGPLFLQRLDEHGISLWAKPMAGDIHTYSSCITTDNSGAIYITGWFTGSVDFAPLLPAGNKTSAGAEDIFVVKHNRFGNFIWAQTFGSDGEDKAYSIETNDCNKPHVTGGFSNTVDFAPGAGVNNLTSTSLMDGFAMQLSQAGGLIWVNQLESDSDVFGQSIAVDIFGHAFVSGQFSDNLEIDGVNKFAGTDNFYTAKLKSNLDPPTITSNPEDVSSGRTCTETFTVGGTAPSYQWQYSPTGSAPWTNLFPGINYAGITYTGTTGNPTLTAHISGSASGNYYYRCVLSKPCAPNAYSEAALLYVNPISYCEEGGGDGGGTGGAAGSPTQTSNENSLEKLKMDYSIYPNPFTNDINITVNSADKEPLTIRIFDLTGKMVFESSNYTTNQIITLGEELQRGAYMIQLVQNDHSELIKVIKN